MRFFLMFSFLFAFIFGGNGSLIGNRNSMMNANSKKCSTCKYFMPQTMKEGELPIGDYYGKCDKFTYRYFMGDEEDYDNKFAIYCRMNDKLCGKDGKYYEKK